MTSSNDLDTWDQYAAQVLHAIRCFIDALRSAQYLQDVSHHEGETRKDTFSLEAHLGSNGIFDLVRQLNGYHDNIRNDEISSAHKISLSSHDELLSTSDERYTILQLVIFPLLTHLHICYAVLDNAPQSPQSAPSTSQRNKNKPQPTKGMLSLKDYTNVACILEFSVCTSLLPYMGYYPFWEEEGVIDRLNAMNLVNRRIRSLPKSLAGRISCQSLRWGMGVAADAWCTISDEEHAVHKKKQLLHQNCNELAQLAITLGRLVLLDRFRPMLLPRHLADLYMSLLFFERCTWNLEKCAKSIDQDASLLQILSSREEVALQVLQSALLFISFRKSSSIPTQNIIDLTTDKALRSIDHREAALACRTLIGSEAAVCMTSQVKNACTDQYNNHSYDLRIPPWLRMRLGRCLTKLANDDLHAVVDVFVASTIGMGSDTSQQDEDIMTSAAARLARVLCAKPTSFAKSHGTTIDFQTSLCRQFLDFLVAEGRIVYKAIIEGTEKSKSEVLERKISRSSLAMLYTLWASICQFSDEVLQTSFVPILSSGLIPSNEDTSAHRLTSLQSISAIWIWLSVIPSSIDQCTIKRLHSIILNDIPRSSSCTLLGQILRVTASCHQDSAESKLVSEINSDFHSITAMQYLTKITLNQIVCSLLQERIHVNFVALELVKAVAANQLDRDGYAFNYSKIFTRGACKSQPIHILEGVQQRSRLIVDDVIGPISAIVENILADDDYKSSDLDRMEYSLPSALFRLVLMIYFCASSSTNDDSAIAAKVNIKLSQYGFHDLLQTDLDGSKIATTILLGALCEKCSPISLILGKANDQNELNADIFELLGIIIDCAACRLKKEHITYNSAASPGELFSTASIVVSLLVSLLELGAKKRSEHDEDMLQAMLPSLEVLSTSLQIDKFCTCSESDPETSDLPVQLAELAEMSSHAMALIISRKIDSEDYTIKQTAQSIKTGMEFIAEELSIIERDLQSSQPPLRAKSVVSLRHLARSLTPYSTTSGTNMDRKHALVHEIKSDCTKSDRNAQSDQVGLITRSLARLSFDSLSDDESYVYLAGIQTLVAIGDACPREILPLTATLVAMGKIDMSILTSEAHTTNTSISLSPEQRVKCTEALIFMIRRRGDGIYVFGRRLLNLMLFGLKQPYPSLHENNLSSDEFSFDIHHQTHSYFVGANGDTDDNDLEERDIRVNTGGPVFKVEEDDLLRATSISVVCELVSVLKAATIVPYCQILVNMVIDALQLDASRPIRRASALLAKEIYGSVENEVTCNLDVAPNASIAVAIVCSRESVLFSALKSCVSRYEDVATQSRCKEAIEIREHLESLSIFNAAALVAESMRAENEPVVKVIQAALS